MSEVAGQASDKENATGETQSLKIILPPSTSKGKINLDPYNQTEDDENDWQTAPVLRQRKRMRSSPTPSPEHVKTQNRFSLLNIEENDKSATIVPKVYKPPPIVLYGVTNISKLKEIVDNVLEQSQYSFKIITKSQLRITTENTSAYKKLMEVVREKQLIGHTFTPKSDRPYRIVIKNLHHSTPTDAIKEAIENTGNSVVGEIINARHGSTKTPLSTWFVNLAPGPNNEAVKNLKCIYHTSVSIEDPKRKKTIPQCKRCQQYGHTKNYCMRPYRCVKCAENHNTTDCPKKDRREPAKCALCLGDHAANYRGCRVFQEIQKRKLRSRLPQNAESSQNKAHDRNVNIKPDQPKTETLQFESLNLPNSNVTYAQVTAGTNLELILAKQAEKLDRLLDQMGNLMGLLTTIVNNLVVARRP